MSIFSDILGTTKGYFKLGLNGVRLKNNAGALAVRNTGDTADAAVTASQVNVSGNTVVLNSAATSSGSSWLYNLVRPSTGQTADVTLTLPTGPGTPNQVLSTDGTGVLSWASAASTASSDKLHTTSVAFGSASPVTMFTSGATDVFTKFEIIVDTPFNGTSPSLSIGVSGTTSKYVAATDVDLTTAGTYHIHPSLIAQGVESLIATYVSGGSTTGAARIQTYYATPA